MNGTTLPVNQENQAGKIGYFVSLFGASLILLWIGIFKFTPTEANAIRPLIENHFLTFFVYNFVSVQAVSNAIGVIEIIIALLLLFSVKFAFLGRYAAIGMIVIFLTTLSYLLTTPGIWKVVDSIPVTDFFILKDLLFLGFGLMLLNGKNEYK
ncbi:membrane protein [Chryseobacterium sp. FH2]|uniref:DUF417 family protein n=1 Tax=Chryseobacterium sp. FH2 TaxID=1674291 RepID=UPI00065AE1FC|nr:DUF417 family protein [Chryseobacterium sp. FH2]KMQ69358.1 membrane protein [Chryseobacterium sp. FH2]